MSVAREDPEATRPGRRRDPSRDAAIVDATLASFVEDGYSSLTIEGVAARAGVGKATIYRRYASKAELVVDAVRCGAGIADTELPDTGDVHADLAGMLRPLLTKLKSGHGDVLITLMTERLRNPDLAEEFERSVIGKKRAHVRGLMRAAMERGDLPADTDIELVAESGPGIIWHHALHGLPLTDDLPERVIEMLLPARPAP
jgi:AcrR family transcriptional regulator